MLIKAIRSGRFTFMESPKVNSSDERAKRELREKICEIE